MPKGLRTETPQRPGQCANNLHIAGKRKSAVFRIPGVARGANLLQSQAVPKPKAQQPARCQDCFFHQQMLCALKGEKPCPTFRPAERGLAPERQLSFVFRADRTHSAYAFPPAPGATSGA
jgi:hypothetical protein